MKSNSNNLFFKNSLKLISTIASLMNEFIMSVCLIKQNYLVHQLQVQHNQEILHLHHAR